MYIVTNSVRYDIRPYHALLLMVDEATLLEALPLDSSPSVTRLVRVASPLKNLQTLAADADLSLGQVSAKLAAMQAFSVQGWVSTLCVPVVLI